MLRSTARADDGAELRAAILAEARETLGGVIGFDGMIDDLVSGRAVRLHRWELSLDRPERDEGDLQDDLILDEHNVFRLAT